MPNKFDFGSMVFNEAVMRERLAEDTYAALKDTIKRGAPLARHIATPVAAAMKEWDPQVKKPMMSSTTFRIIVMADSGSGTKFASTMPRPEMLLTEAWLGTRKK